MAKKQISPFRSRQGQAVLEYLLMLFVVVSLGYGIVYQFNTAFRSFAENYFGAYLECLLEVGELPSLGSSQQSICESEFQPFSLAEGRPPKPSQNPQTVASRENSRDREKDGSGTEPLERGDGRPGLNNKEKSSAGSGGGGGGSGDADFASRRGGTNSDSQSEGGEGNESGLRPSRVPVFANAGAGGGQGDDNDGNTQGRLRFIPTNSADGEENILARREIPADGESSSGSAVRRVPAESEKKAKDTKDLDAGLTIPDFLRYLIIAIIVIAIVVFMGGQVLQFSKSQQD